MLATACHKDYFDYRMYVRSMAQSQGVAAMSQSMVALL